MTASVHPSVTIFFDLDPLVAGEDRAAYEALREGLHRVLQPADALEQIWTQEAVRLTWELARIERLRTDILERSRRSVLRETLCAGLSYTRRRWMEGLLKRYWARDPDAVAHVERLLAKTDLDGALWVTIAYGECLPRLEILDRMASRTEFRRARLLREVGRRRDFALRVRAHAGLVGLARSPAALDPTQAAPQGRTPGQALRQGRGRDAAPRPLVPEAQGSPPPPSRPAADPPTEVPATAEAAPDGRLGRAPAPGAGTECPEVMPSETQPDRQALMPARETWPDQPEGGPSPAGHDAGGPEGRPTPAAAAAPGALTGGSKLPTGSPLSLAQGGA
ncbi:MAG TPA: hypothetical protein VHL98_21330 [Microvirga sp.]|jgi:hypothetical protein|nr:hypothetical protein [Microvirga sp.]